MRPTGTATNEELVLYLQQILDEDVFEQLFNRFVPLFIKSSQIYSIKGFEVDDYLQEGRIALYHAIPKFQPSRMTHFARFIQLVYKNHIYNLIRSDRAQKRGGNIKEVSFEFHYATPHHDENGANGLNYLEQSQHLTPEDWTVVRERTRYYFTQLSQLELQVFRYFLSLNDLELVAERLKLPLHRVKNAYDRCRQKLKKLTYE